MTPRKQGSKDNSEVSKRYGIDFLVVRFLSGFFRADREIRSIKGTHSIYS